LLLILYDSQLSVMNFYVIGNGRIMNLATFLKYSNLLCLPPRGLLMILIIPVNKWL
jgi:hypothetical protein